jgi:hypothetical protein
MPFNWHDPRPEFPFLSTCLVIGSSFNASIGQNDNVSLEPWNMAFNEGDNNDGVTILDVTNPEEVRYAFVFFNQEDGRTVEKPQHVPLTASEYWAFYMDRQKPARLDVELLQFFKSRPVIDEESLASVWPHASWTPRATQGLEPVSYGEMEPPPTPPLDGINPLRAQHELFGNAFDISYPNRIVSQTSTALPDEPNIGSTTNSNAQPDDQSLGSPVFTYRDSNSRVKTNDDLFAVAQVVYIGAIESPVPWSKRVEEFKFSTVFEDLTIGVFSLRESQFTVDSFLAGFKNWTRYLVAPEVVPFGAMSECPLCGLAAAKSFAICGDTQEDSGSMGPFTINPLPATLYQISRRAYRCNSEWMPATMAQIVFGEWTVFVIDSVGKRNGRSRDEEFLKYALLSRNDRGQLVLANLGALFGEEKAFSRVGSVHLVSIEDEEMSDVLTMMEKAKVMEASITAGKRGALREVWRRKNSSLEAVSTGTPHDG